MGYEVEIKFAVADRADLERRLAAIGATASPEIEQEDLYLAHPARDFALTREAFRLRREGRANRITYKGPKRLAGPTKTREEVEVAFADGPASWDDLLRVFEALGFRPVATVRKIRLPYQLERDGLAIEVVLDRAVGLGDFAEVEALAADAGDGVAAAQAAVVGLAAELGLSSVETRSYLRMTLELDANPAGQP